MMETTHNHEHVFDEWDVIDLLYQGKNVSTLVVSDPRWVTQFNAMTKLFDIDSSISYQTASKLSSEDFVRECVSEDKWNIPEEYIHLDIKDMILSKCTRQEEIDRVLMEYSEFEKRNMIPVLRFLLYFFDTLRAHNLVWGVGRGSSVASYVLYKMGVHRVDSLLYDIDIKEFLK